MTSRLLAYVMMDMEVSSGKKHTQILQVSITNVTDGRFRVEVLQSEATGRQEIDLDGQESPEFREIKAGAYAWTISAAVSDARNRAKAAGIHGMIVERALWAAEDAAEIKLAEGQ